MKPKALAVVLLYFFLAAGGLWNALGWFQPLMIISAPWFVLLLGIGAALFTAFETKPTRGPVAVWSVVIFILSLSAEILGVNSGFPFGVYVYGDNMGPFILNTPLAIGGAWLSVTLSSVYLTRLIFDRLGFSPKNIFVYALSAALLAVAFDFVLEIAAVRLGYWSWHEKAVPIQNYLSWFVLSGFFSLAAFRLFAGPGKKISAVWHLYPAQLIYFLISLW